MIVTGFRRSLEYFLHMARMSFSLLSKTPIWFLMDPKVWMFWREDAGWFATTLCLLASNWNPVHGLIRISVPRIQRIFGFVLRSGLAGYLLCSNSILHLLVPPPGYFFSSIHHTESFPSTYPSSRWSCSCFEQPPLHLRCAFQELSEQGLKKFVAKISQQKIYSYIQKEYAK